MKKKLILLFVMALLPLSVFAKNYYDEYNTLNFPEVLVDEEFEAENPSYSENDKQAIIYLFRGKGCTYCRRFIEFLNSISNEYGKYFRLVSFEVWYDQNNSTLMSKVAGVTGVEAGGVPYIVIGQKVFAGYSDSYDEDIKSQIMSQYNNPEEDIFKTLEKSEKKANGGDGVTSFAVLFWTFVFVAIGTVTVIVCQNKNTEKILEALGEEADETSKEVKKERKRKIKKKE